MRADRLLSMIWLLRAHGGLSTGELARRLEVSRRTILRDVEALSAAGVPVYCQRGPGGGVRLLPGYRTDVTALSGDESRALFAALSSWGADAMGLSAAFVSGVRKLLAAVPDAHRNRTAAAASRIVIDPNGWLPQPDALQPGEAFATLQAAVFARKKVRLDYRSSRAVVQDLVAEPHGLVSAGSDWYLCATSDERMRFLKVARIRTATLLATPCADDAVDVAAAWKRHRARFLDRFTPVVVTGWLRADQWEDAREWAIRVDETELGDDPPAGKWRPASLEFMDDLHALTILLRLGPGIRVEAPIEIRTRLLTHLDRITELYHR